MATTPTNPGQPGPMQPSDYTPAASSQVVSWQLRRLPPPSSLYVTVDDVLRVAAATSQANEVVTVSYRLIRAADGKLVYGQLTIAPANTRVLKVVDNPLAEGFLLSVSCKAAVATTRGQTFVRLFLNPKILGPGQPGFMFMADYVTTAMAPGFPNGRTIAPSEGPGWMRAISVGLPGAGNDWILNVPTNTRWRLQGVRAALQADATVGNRNVTLVANSSGFLAWQALAPAAQVAGQGITYSWAPGLFTGVSTTYGIAATAIPYGHILTSANTDSVQTVTLGMDVGDQWQGIIVSVEELLDNV